MDDEYSSNNSNNDMSVLPVGMNSFANQFVSTANSNSSMNGGGGGGSSSRTIEGIRGMSLADKLGPPHTNLT